MLAKEVTVDSSVNLVNPALQENLQQRRESFGLFFVCLFVWFCFFFCQNTEKFLQNVSSKANNTSNSENKIK